MLRIFRAGKHAKQLTPAVLAATVAAYDLEKHEAPASSVIQRAYGWVNDNELSFDEQTQSRRPPPRPSEIQAPAEISINLLPSEPVPVSSLISLIDLHYNHHRYYDPQLGRYITSDPIGLQGGMNTYSYAMQNGVRYYDPDGQALPFISCWMFFWISWRDSWCCGWYK